MSSEPVTTPRRPRADAARNRQRLVDAARTAFTAQGEDTSLEAVARAAGVGIGTLYRNFPTREDLIAAVYRAELDAALATVDDLLAPGAGSGSRNAADAFRAFAGRYAEFVVTKRGLAETVRAGALRGTAEAAGTRERVNAAVQRFLDAGSSDGSLRPDLLADDVTAALVGILLSTRDASDTAQTGRLLDILVAGLSRPAVRTA
ncbi:TetR/AcrR family transcriptional regulator [Curtobacterium sp. A7_M15]|uniref:TetR/AcrR family transcriptional regulator n=1 Tax=Curtobacterium sp. A7_M15 TaxID=3065241 RepID=UPI0027377DA6|nr:TetR/AcrR family transcriptional regulator [Curtobacterium sp. A7_M15]MDP4333354.1 TetR/AcrR family transcriptional regulator [Curtobacterium sp. A7_M15]